MFFFFGFFKSITHPTLDGVCVLHMVRAPICVGGFFLEVDEIFVGGALGWVGVGRFGEAEGRVFHNS